jgi:hypothetical protein
METGLHLSTVIEKLQENPSRGGIKTVSIVKCYHRKTLSQFSRVN